jgi:hypothetical protein
VESETVKKYGFWAAILVILIIGSQATVRAQESNAKTATFNISGLIVNTNNTNETYANIATPSWIMDSINNPTLFNAYITNFINFKVQSVRSFLWISQFVQPPNSQINQAAITQVINAINTLKTHNIKSIITPFGFYDVMDNNFWQGDWGVATAFNITQPTQYLTDTKTKTAQATYITSLCQQIKTAGLSNWVTIEVSDEPENLVYAAINTQQQVIDWYTYITNTIKTVDPTIKTATGMGLMPYTTQRQWLFNLNNALVPLCDYATNHWYYNPNTLIPASMVSTTKPVLLDECGYAPNDYQAIEGTTMPYTFAEYVTALNTKATTQGYQAIWWWAYKDASYWTAGSWPSGQTKGEGDFDQTDTAITNQLGKITT